MDLVNNLPHEVLPNIFKFLILEDRKNVRSTCQLWNIACDCSDITKFEKFVFQPSNIATEEDVEIVKTAISSRKNFPPEFAFKWIDVALLPQFLWERCGRYIETLTFEFCYNFTAETLRNIIMHCSRLKILCTDETQIRIDSLFNNKIIVELIDLKVTRKSLHSFLFSTSLDVNIPDDETFRRIFQIFPSIRKFSGDSFPAELTRTILGEEFESSSHSVRLNFETVLYSSNAWTVPLSENSKLKFNAFCGHFDCRGDLNLKSLKHFVFKHPELLGIKLDLSGNYEKEESKNLLFAILSRASKLRWLKYFSPIGISFNHSELKIFSQAIRSLTHLSLNFFSVNNIDPSELLFAEINYPKMKELELEGCTAEFYSFLLDRCVGLTYLSLLRSRISGKILQHIFKNHAKLEVLWLSGFEDEAQTRPARKNIDLPENERNQLRFHQLCGLKRLVITCGPFVYLNIDDVLYSIPEIIAQLELSNLTHFQYSLTVPSSEWNLSKFLEVMAVKAPSLKRLNVLTYNIVNTWCSDDCFTHLKKFKKLKSLEFPLLHLGYPMTESSLKSETSILRDLFIECPLLKVVGIQGLGYFFYNRVSNEILFRAW